MAIKELIYQNEFEVKVTTKTQISVSYLNRNTEIVSGGILKTARRQT
jgi:hypothetical protein